MQLGQVVDFCIDYNDRLEKAQKQKKGKPSARPEKRRATQADIDAFFGG